MPMESKSFQEDIVLTLEWKPWKKALLCPLNANHYKYKIAMPTEWNKLLQENLISPMECKWFIQENFVLPIICKSWQEDFVMSVECKFLQQDFVIPM